MRRKNLHFGYCENVFKCFRSKNRVRRSILFKNGIKKVQGELDLASVIKRFRVLDFIAKLQFNPSQLQLLQYLKMNMVSTTDAFEEHYQSSEQDDSFSSISKTMKVKDEDTLMIALRGLIYSDLENPTTRTFMRDLGIKLEGAEDQLLTARKEQKPFQIMKAIEIPGYNDDASQDTRRTKSMNPRAGDKFEKDQDMSREQLKS